MSTAEIIVSVTDECNVKYSASVLQYWQDLEKSLSHCHHVQIPYKTTQNQIWASVMGNWQLTICAMYLLSL